MNIIRLNIFLSNLFMESISLCIKHNGFGYDCGATLGAKLAEDLTALSLEIRAGRASPGRSTIEAKNSFI